MLADLFADELSNIQKKYIKVRAQDDMRSSMEMSRSQARNGTTNRTMIKLSDREQESENLK